MTYVVTHVLGIDEAARSGWALLDIDAGRRIASGVAADIWGEDISNAVARASVEVEHDLSRLLVMLEDHSKMPLTRKMRGDRKHHGAPQRNTGTILGMGEQLGRWRHELDRHRHPKSLRLKVEPRAWRLVVLSLRGKLPGEEMYKRIAVAAANSYVGGTVRIEDDNEAEALHIARYGAIAGVQLLEKRRAMRRTYERDRRRIQLHLEEVDDA